MSRMFVTLAIVSTTAVAALVPAPGTAGNGNPNWTNSPVQGPSPNTDHEVENTEGGECPGNINGAGFGGVALGGRQGAVVDVILKNQSDTEMIKSETYEPDENGDWGGTFEIPGGLDPGVYPLEALCAFPVPPAPAGFGGPVVLGGEVLFAYAERSYTVIEEAEEPTPVEAEVTLTG